MVFFGRFLCNPSNPTSSIYDEISTSGVQEVYGLDYLFVIVADVADFDTVVAFILVEDNVVVDANFGISCIPMNPDTGY